MKKIVIAGGSGFIGSYIAKKYQDLSYDVTIISRKETNKNFKTISWNEESLLQEIDKSDILLNLAGKSVDCRYNDRNKRAIFESRINTTQKLAKIIQLCKNPPKLWMNSSTATIYRHSEDKAMTEENGELGEGFSVGVAKAWEDAFFEKEFPSTRQIALRTAIVLGQDGGVICPYKHLVKFGFGGKQGSGKQMISWIHIEDLFQIVRFLERSEYLSGIFNCASPNPVRNKEFMRIFRHIMGKKVKIPINESLLKYGAALIQTEAELILRSRYVIPQKLLDYGFNFNYPQLIEALEQILRNQKEIEMDFHLNS